MEEITYSLFKDFSKDNFCLLYDGNIVDDVTYKIIDLSEHSFENTQDFVQSKKRVSFLLAECFQNIIRHSGKIKMKGSKDIDAGFFLTRNIEGIYYITSGNLIKTQNVDDLKTRLEKINSLDQERLKSLYLDVLANKGFSDRGGAGLGLIEIARKSGQKLEYVFKELIGDYFIFYNQVMIKPKNTEEEKFDNNRALLFKAIHYHQKMLEENIIIIQKGDFSHSSVLPVLEILKKNLTDLFHYTHPRKEAYHALVELLQCLGKYAIEENGRREGIFIIKRKGERLVISTGNYVEKTNAVTLSDQLNLLNNLSKEEMKEKYLKVLNEEDTALRIELIEIARRSSEPIHYHFNETPENKVFFTFCVEV